MSGDKVTQADRRVLATLGYTVVDASNSVVECGWLMRAPGIDDRAWIAATEDDAWHMAYDHSRPNRTTELVEALQLAEAYFYAVAPECNELQIIRRALHDRER